MGPGVPEVDANCWVTTMITYETRPIEQLRNGRLAPPLTPETVPPHPQHELVLSHRLKAHRHLLCPDADALASRRAAVLGVVIHALDGLSQVTPPPLPAGVAEYDRSAKAGLPWVVDVDPREVNDVVGFRIDSADADENSSQVRSRPVLTIWMRAGPMSSLLPLWMTAVAWMSGAMASLLASCSASGSELATICTPGLPLPIRAPLGSRSKSVPGSWCSTSVSFE